LRFAQRSAGPYRSTAWTVASGWRAAIAIAMAPDPVPGSRTTGSRWPAIALDARSTSRRLGNSGTKAPGPARISTPAKRQRTREPPNPTLREIQGLSRRGWARAPRKEPANQAIRAIASS
jgi:hypothetical protein